MTTLAEELEALDDLLGFGDIIPVPSKAKAKGKPKTAQVVPVESREAPVPVGLVLMTVKRRCRCCGAEEVLVSGEMIKYTYRGAVIKKPEGETTKVDMERMKRTKAGTREVEEGEVQEIARCAECSEELLKVWGGVR